MPDQYGRLNRLELREAIRRRVDVIRATIAPVSPPPASPTIPGDETALLALDPLVSNQDINIMINTAIIKYSVDVNVADNTIMADSVVADILTGQVEYQLPVDLFFLRAVYWKPDNLTIVPIPPGQRIFMYEDDSDSDINQPLIQGVGIPSYRRRLGTIVLNQVPQIDNPQGLMVDYTKCFLGLNADDQYIETPLNQVIQECVVLGVVYEITTARMKIDAADIKQSLTDFEGRLTLAVTNYHAPKTVRMVSPVVVARPPFGGRRAISWSRRTWWGSSWG